GLHEIEQDEDRRGVRPFRRRDRAVTGRGGLYSCCRATASGAMVRNRGRHQRVLSHPGCMRSGAPGADLREGAHLNSSRPSLIGKPQGLPKRRAPAHPRTRQIRKERTMKTTQRLSLGLLGVLAGAMVVAAPAAAQQQQKRPNIVMLMTDDTGWNDFGAYTGGG